MSNTETVNVHLLEREYTVGVEAGERSSLMAAVDRVAVLAALNLAHELQQLRDQCSARDSELTRTLGELHRKLDGVLDAPR